MVARTIDVYEVMDACTEMFLGYSFGVENFATQYDAYRMALETWKVKLLCRWHNSNWHLHRGRVVHYSFFLPA